MKSLPRKSHKLTLLVAIVVAGCGKAPPTVFPDRLKAYPTPNPSASFQRLCEASQMAATACQKYLDKPKLTAGELRAAINLSAPAVNLLVGNLNPIPEFAYAPHSPLQPAPYRLGWVFLGNILRWEAHEQLLGGSVDDGLRTAAIALKLGLAVSGGDAYDMNLGYSIIAGICDEVWDKLYAASPASLREFHNSLAKALRAAPQIRLSIRNETANMLSAVNALQDSFVGGNLEPFKNALGPQYKPAFDFLEKLKSEAGDKQLAYFNGFANEAERISQTLISMTEKPTQSWTPSEYERPSEPWWRLGTVYFSQVYKMPAWYLKNQTLLRLLAIRSALVARLLSGEKLPPNLSGLPQSLSTDVYTGKPLMYLAQGSDFKLYSVGPDRRDDGGEGGPTGQSPDLVFGR